MQTEVDLMQLSPHQREFLTPSFGRCRKAKIVEMVTHSPGVVSEATKQAVLERFKAVIEKLEHEPA